MLHQRLDDVPITLVISVSLAVLGRRLPLTGPGSVPRSDNCAGLTTSALAARGQDLELPAPLRDLPTAPPVPDADVLGAWHDLLPLEPSAVRRYRLLDVWVEGATCFETFYRDAHMSRSGVEKVVHEYRLRRELVRDGVTLRRATVTPGDLPWAECPNAVASADALLGTSTLDLRSRAGDVCVGSTSCTHLTDMLRLLEDVPQLARALPGTGWWRGAT